MRKQNLKKHFINFRGARLNQKILVFESDDWGSIRIPNNEIKEELLGKGLIKNTDAFSKFDSLETSEDYQALFDVLRHFKDIQGNHPIITANVILNNPNFNRIRKHKFQTYFNEPFYQTYQDYPGSETAFQMLKFGIEQKMLMPQFHGKEHLNVMRWMDFLKSGNERYHFAFDRDCFAIDETGNQNRRNNLMAAYDYDNELELDYVKKSVSRGLKQFEEIFGFKSITSVAPCYVWDDHVEKILYDEEVESIQSSYVQNTPIEGKSFKKTYHYTGQQNKLGQHYFVRNGLFEPSLNTNVDWVDKCLESIAIAFKWRKPAIIGTHRINFCGRLDEKQRNKNLKDLEDLFSQIQKKWPDILFMDSASLISFFKTKN